MCAEKRKSVYTIYIYYYNAYEYTYKRASSKFHPPLSSYISPKLYGRIVSCSIYRQATALGWAQIVCYLNYVYTSDVCVVGIGVLHPCNMPGTYVQSMGNSL